MSLLKAVIKPAEKQAWLVVTPCLQCSATAYGQEAAADGLPPIALPQAG